jgi:hypothetical protein
VAVYRATTRRPPSVTSVATVVTVSVSPSGLVTTRSFVPIVCGFTVWSSV